MIPAGVAGRNVGLPWSRQPGVDRVEAVDVLDRLDRPDHPVLVDLVGQRQLHEDPGDPARRRSGRRRARAAPPRSCPSGARGGRTRCRPPRRPCACGGRRRAKPGCRRRARWRARPAVPSSATSPSHLGANALGEGLAVHERRSHYASEATVVIRSIVTGVRGRSRPSRGDLRDLVDDVHARR